MFFPLESVQDTGHLTCSTPGRSQTRGSLTPVVADEQVEMALSGCGRGVSRRNLCGVSAHTVRECLAVEGPCASELQQRPACCDDRSVWGGQ